MSQSGQEVSKVRLVTLVCFFSGWLYMSSVFCPIVVALPLIFAIVVGLPLFCAIVVGLPPFTIVGYFQTVLCQHLPNMVDFMPCKYSLL